MRRIILWCVAALLAPGAAFALSCSQGLPSGGLFDAASCVSGGVFSGLMCNVQGLVNSIMSSIYCGVQNAMMGPLEAAISLYIIIFGVQLMLGYVESPVGDALMRLLKIALIWVFATYSSWGIGVAYNFFFFAMQEGIGWMLTSVTGPTLGIANASTAFYYMDQLAYNLFTGPLTAQGAMLAGFITTLSIVLPPVGFLFAILSAKTLLILVRALLAYLMGISVIAFLIGMSPIFFSLALFKVTRQFFEDWLRQIISFTLQVVFMFAGLALWFRVLATLGGAFLNQLASMIEPVYDISTIASISLPVQGYGICYPAAPCDHPWLASQLVEEGSFIYFLVINLVSLCIVAYCFDTLMKLLPSLAKQLAGPAYAPQLGGPIGMTRPDIGAVRYPGMSQLSQIGLRGMGGGGFFSGLNTAFADAAPRQGDQENADLARLRDQANTLALSAEQELRDYTGAVSDARRGEIEREIQTLKEAAQAGNRSLIINSTRELNQMLIRLRR